MEIDMAEMGGFLQSPKEDEKDEKKKVIPKLNKNCGQCDFHFETTKELLFHLRKSPGHVPKCVFCDTTFADFNNYVKHVGKFHMREGEIVCQAWVNILPNARVGDGWNDKLFLAKFSKISILGMRSCKNIGIFPCFLGKIDL